MFSFCSSLVLLNLSNFNTQNVTNMDYMLYNCSSLTSLDLSNFINKEDTSMENMFYNCFYLKYLDISGFTQTIDIFGTNAVSENCTIIVNNNANINKTNIPISCKIIVKG